MRRIAPSSSLPAVLGAALLCGAALLSLACGDVNNSLPDKPTPITKEGGAAGGANAAMPKPPSPGGSAAPAASGGAGSAEAAAGGGADPMVAKGKSIYGSVCIACHNVNPNLAGAIGPDIAGSSLELLKTKVLRNEYPEGYTPKRDTLNMVPLPHLEADLPAVAAYLESVKEG